MIMCLKGKKAIVLSISKPFEKNMAINKNQI